MNTHRDMLEEMMREKSIEYLVDYIAQLEQRVTETNDFIKYLKTLLRKKTRKNYETGSRGGKG